MTIRGVEKYTEVKGGPGYGLNKGEWFLNYIFDIPELIKYFEEKKEVVTVEALQEYENYIMFEAAYDTVDNLVHTMKQDVQSGKVRLGTKGNVQGNIRIGSEKWFMGLCGCLIEMGECKKAKELELLYSFSRNEAVNQLEKINNELKKRVKDSIHHIEAKMSECL